MALRAESKLGDDHAHPDNDAGSNLRRVSAQGTRRGDVRARVSRRRDGICAVSLSYEGRTMSDIIEDVQARLLRKSIKWRVAAGWVMVAILAYRYLIVPTANFVMLAMGQEPLPDLPPIEWTDVLAIIGLPVGGAFADKLKDD